MNDPRSTRQSPHPSARGRSAKRRRRRRTRIHFLIHQIILILVSMAIGYFLGVHAGQADIDASQIPPATDPHVPTETHAAPAPSTAPEEPTDTTPPQILGVNKLSIFLGSTISYRSGILVTDDTDPAPKLTVDSFQVNLSAPGIYPLYYIATDSSGNVTTLETTVTVVEASEACVDEAIIRDTADQLLDKILTDGQTPAEQVNAIYDWIEGHCYYIANFDKSDYMQAAYLMMTENRGDCYGFYAVSRLLFERLGLPNLSVTRLPNDVRTTSHYWNMVSLDGGESWYHFDATPHLTYPTRTCLVTDGDLEEFNQLMPNYYYFDHTAFPGTPAA